MPEPASGQTNRYYTQEFFALGAAHLSLRGVLAFRLMLHPAARRDGTVLGILLLVQVTLGIQNVLLQLPLVNAVAHNGVGALLLATMLWLLYRSTDRSI